jgi:hypothetical protein
MWTGLISVSGTGVMTSSASVALGQAYYLFGGGDGGGGGDAWYALNGQENMTDADIAEAISRQEMNPLYWIGR